MSFEIKSVCVTGGAGFIGSAVVRRLLAEGYKVTVIDNLSVGRRENVPDAATLCVGDILDPETVAIAGDHDAVIHLAARVAIRSSFEFIVEDTTTNVVGTATLLRSISEHAQCKVRKFLIASSMAVYAEGFEDGLTPEDHLLAPASPYGVSKLACEMLVRQVCEKQGIDAGILRLFNTYGKGQALSPYVGVVTIFADAMKGGKTPVIFGDGRQRRDFVHVEDVASGFLRALVSRTEGQCFNIGSGKGMTIGDVYARLAEALDFHHPAKHAESVPGELKYSVADISKARQWLDYNPQYEFGESIGAVVND